MIIREDKSVTAMSEPAMAKQMIVYKAAVFSRIALLA